MKNFILLPLISLSFLACNEKSSVKKTDAKKNDNVVEEVGKSAIDPFQNSYKSSGNNSMVEDIYQQIIVNNKELTKLDTQIKNINTKTAEVTKEYEDVLSKSSDYYHDALSKTKKFKDSLLQKKIDSMIAVSAENYTSKNQELISKLQLAQEQLKTINDRYEAFKIKKSLYEIEKYQNDNTFDLKSIKELIDEQNEILRSL